MPARRSFLSTAIRLDGILDVLMLLGLSSSWLGLLGSLHWTLDLLSHFRWQYLIFALLVLVWTLIRQRWLVLGAAFLTLLFNAWLIGCLAFGAKSPSNQGEERLQVVSLNVLTSNPHKDRVLQYLLESNPDIIFLMEVDEAWAQMLQSLKTKYPYGLIEDQQSNFGIALLSRVPLEATELFQTSDTDTPSVQARLSYQGLELLILGIHPMPPMNGWMARSRDAQLRGIAEKVRQTELPVLVMGDLNSTPWSQGMRLLRAGNSLAYRCPTPAWAPTWQPETLLALPIDHALCTPPLFIANRNIGPDVGSDHRPQELEVIWE